MLVNKIKVERIVSHSDPFVLYIYADTHIGPNETDEQKLRKHVLQCYDEQANWVHLGDWCDYISSNDKRYAVGTKIPSIFDQLDLVDEIFEPIIGLGIGSIIGNHGEKIRKTFGDPMKRISRNLQVPYFGDSGFIKLQMNDGGTRWSKTLFMAHGFGGGRKYGGKVNKITDLAAYIDADFYALGHMHTYVPIKNTALGVSRNGTIKVRDRHFVLCPSYLDIYKPSNVPNYGSSYLYPPSPIGCVRVEFTPTSTKVEMIE